MNFCTTLYFFEFHLYAMDLSLSDVTMLEYIFVIIIHFIEQFVLPILCDPYTSYIFGFDYTKGWRARTYLSICPCLLLDLNEIVPKLALEHKEGERGAHETQIQQFDVPGLQQGYHYLSYSWRWVQRCSILWGHSYKSYPHILLIELKPHKRYLVKYAGIYLYSFFLQC